MLHQHHSAVTWVRCAPSPQGLAESVRRGPCIPPDLSPEPPTWRMNYLNNDVTFMVRDDVTMVHEGVRGHALLLTQLLGTHIHLCGA